MNIIQSFPPNKEKINKVLPHVKGYCYCYGNTIYSPDNDGIPDHVMEHEKVHSRQQGADPDAWWNKYITNPTFRMNQEMEAYKVQYNYAKGFIKDRNKLDKFLRSLASDLSGEAYGSAISHSDAMSLIKNVL
jgi:hypothetical protein